MGYLLGKLSVILVQPTGKGSSNRLVLVLAHAFLWTCSLTETGKALCTDWYCGCASLTHNTSLVLWMRLIEIFKQAGNVSETCKGSSYRLLGGCASLSHSTSLLLWLMLAQLFIQTGTVPVSATVPVWYLPLTQLFKQTGTVSVPV